MERLKTGPEIDDYFADLRGRIDYAPSSLERQRHVDEFFTSAEHFLIVRPELATWVFIQMAYFHSGGYDEQRLWGYLSKCAASKNPLLREGFECGFLQDIPYPPIVLRDLETLWKWSLSPERQWTIAAAYRVNREQYELHVRRLPKWLRGKGVDVATVVPTIQITWPTGGRLGAGHKRVKRSGAHPVRSKVTRLN